MIISVNAYPFPFRGGVGEGGVHCDAYTCKGVQKTLKKAKRDRIDTQCKEIETCLNKNNIMK